MTTLITPLAIGIAFAVASIHRDRARKARREVERLTAELHAAVEKRSAACRESFHNGYALAMDVRRDAPKSTPSLDPILATVRHEQRQLVLGHITTETQ